MFCFFSLFSSFFGGCDDHHDCDDHHHCGHKTTTPVTTPVTTPTTPASVAA